MAADWNTAKTSTFSIQMKLDSGSGHRSTRPSSGRPSSSRPTERETLQRGSHLFNRAKSGLVSYEDLLVAQYLEEMKKQKSAEPGPERELPPSPYLQRLPHANLMHGKMARKHRRPYSASTATISARSSKPKIDAKFIADESMWDPATPRDGHYSRFSRPASAPIRRYRPTSGISVGSGRSRRTRPGSAKSIFKRQPRTITVCAFKNGTRDVFVHACAPNLKILLEFVTEKLGLGFAARRMFLEDGVEIFRGQDIPPHSDVYISTGEGYKDPFGPTKKNLIVRQGAKWNLKGIILPEGGKKRSKHRMPKRVKDLAHTNNMRIIVYLNGKSSEPHEVVVEPHKFDEFLQACTARLELRRFAKKAYDWEGNEITDLEDTPVLDDCLQSKGGQVRGPLWISTGERFSPLGTQEFLLNIKQVIKEKLRNVQFYKKEAESMREKKQDRANQKKALELLQKKIRENKLKRARDSGERMIQKALTGHDPSRPEKKIIIEAETPKWGRSTTKEKVAVKFDMPGKNHTRSEEIFLAEPEMPIQEQGEETVLTKSRTDESQAKKKNSAKVDAPEWCHSPTEEKIMMEAELPGAHFFKLQQEKVAAPELPGKANYMKCKEVKVADPELSGKANYMKPNEQKVADPKLTRKDYMKSKEEKMSAAPDLSGKDNMKPQEEKETDPKLSGKSNFMKSKEVKVADSKLSKKDNMEPKQEKETDPKLSGKSNFMKSKEVKVADSKLSKKDNMEPKQEKETDPKLSGKANYMKCKEVKMADPELSGKANYMEPKQEKEADPKLSGKANYMKSKEVKVADPELSGKANYMKPEEEKVADSKLPGKANYIKPQEEKVADSKLPGKANYIKPQEEKVADPKLSGKDNMEPQEEEVMSKPVMAAEDHLQSTEESSSGDGDRSDWCRSGTEEKVLIAPLLPDVDPEN